MLPAHVQLAKKLATGVTPPAVHRRRDLRREPAGVRAQMHSFARAGEARAAAGSPLRDNACHVPGRGRSRRCTERRRALSFATRRALVAAHVALGGAGNGIVKTTRNIGFSSLHTMRSQGKRPRSRTAVVIRARPSPGHEMAAWHSIHQADLECESGARTFSNLLGLSPAMNVSSCSVNMSSRITKPFRSKCTAASEAVATLATWPVISLPSARDGHSPSRRWPHL